MLGVEAPQDLEQAAGAAEQGHDPSRLTRNDVALGSGSMTKDLVFWGWLSTKWNDLVRLSAPRIYP
jgi:hypothetical protein